jgi:hypothetical protein
VIYVEGERMKAGLRGYALSALRTLVIEMDLGKMSEIQTQERDWFFQRLLDVRCALLSIKSVTQLISISMLYWYGG